ncbi:hypothetical protein BJX64DRAFT_283945 [Aspergillus heterothallicus]
MEAGMEPLTLGGECRRSRRLLNLSSLRGRHSFTSDEASTDINSSFGNGYPSSFQLGCPSLNFADHDREPEHQDGQREEEAASNTAEELPLSQQSMATVSGEELAGSVIVHPRPLPPLPKIIITARAHGLRRSIAIDSQSSGSHTPDGWPRGYKPPSKRAKRTAATTHTQNAAGSPPSYQPQLQLKNSSSLCLPPADDANPIVGEAQSFTSTNPSGNELQLKSSSSLRMSFVPDDTADEHTADSFSSIGQLPSQPQLNNPSSSRPLPLAHDAHDAHDANAVPGEAHPFNSSTNARNQLQTPESTLTLDKPTFGELLKHIKLEKSNDHRNLESEIRTLQKEVDALIKQSKAAKEQSDRAGELYERLQQPGGLLGLDPVEACGLFCATGVEEFLIEM